MAEPANRWILQFKRDHQSPWLPFGMEHPYDEAVERLDEVRVRMPDSEWRIVNTTTGGLAYVRPGKGGG